MPFDDAISPRHLLAASNLSGPTLSLAGVRAFLRDRGRSRDAELDGTRRGGNKTNRLAVSFAWSPPGSSQV